jgi:hypothetical protein
MTLSSLYQNQTVTTTIEDEAVKAGRRLLSDYYPNRNANLIRLPTISSHKSHTPDSTRSIHSTSIRVAFVGNSMMYFNDFPRFFATLTHTGSRGQVTIKQNSCLRGGASITSLLHNGNGMLPQFQTPNAIVYSNDTDYEFTYDYGACTVQELLTGHDEVVQNLIETDSNRIPHHESSVLSKNPCQFDSSFLEWIRIHQEPKQMPYRRSTGQRISSTRSGKETMSSGWDYVVINDSTRDPAHEHTRRRSLDTLSTSYVDWFKSMNRNVTPVFLWTHAYIPKYPSLVRNMVGLEDVANFTSLTGIGYRTYADLLHTRLLSMFRHPERPLPLIVPYGLCCLVVYEENPDLWIKLFHNADHIHASPTGTMLQGLSLYATIFGQMPSIDAIVAGSRSFEGGININQGNGNEINDYNYVVEHHDLSYLFANARMMQHAWDPPNLMVSPADAFLLWEVTRRVVLDGYIPQTYVHYNNEETAFLPPGSSIQPHGIRY